MAFDRGAANGTGASDKASITARWTTTRRALKRSRFGLRHAIRGRLTDEHGKGIGGARVELAATVLARGARAQGTGSARTRADGTYALTLPRTVSSRRLDVRYRSHVNDLTPAASATLQLRVTAGVRLAIAPRVAHRGTTIRLRGRLMAGPVPARGKLLELQARTKGHRWVTFRTIRTQALGRLHLAVPVPPRRAGHLPPARPRAGGLGLPVRDGLLQGADGPRPLIAGRGRARRARPRRAVRCGPYVPARRRPRRLQGDLSQWPSASSNPRTRSASSPSPSGARPGASSWASSSGPGSTRSPTTTWSPHYAKAVADLDEHDLSMLAAWHASLEVGHPIANRDFLVNVFPTLGDNRREALKIAAGFRGEEAFDAGVAEEQALDTVLPHLSRERSMELATECLELYLWDRLGSEN